MKLKVGHRLAQERNSRDWAQAQMAEVLSVSPSAYGRIERGEISCEFEEILRFAEILKVPVQEFLPESILISNNKQNCQAGVIFGNVTFNGDPPKWTLQSEDDKEKEKFAVLIEKVQILENTVSQILNKLSQNEKDKN